MSTGTSAFLGFTFKYNERKCQKQNEATKEEYWFERLRPRLHEYVFISFSSKPQTFFCVFTLHLHENDQKGWSFSLKTVTFENGLQRGKIWKRCRCLVDRSFSLKTETFENDATAATSYSNYLDTQTVDFRWFFTVFNSFCVDGWKRYENYTKTMSRRHPVDVCLAKWMTIWGLLSGCGKLHWKLWVQFLTFNCWALISSHIAKHILFVVKDAFPKDLEPMLIFCELIHTPGRENDTAVTKLTDEIYSWFWFTFLLNVNKV